MTRSMRANISEDGWCIVQAIVQPLLASSLTVHITCQALNESKPVVGSSRNTMEGRVMSSTPMLTRFLSPLLMPFRLGPPIGLSQQSDSPSDRNSSEMWLCNCPVASSLDRCVAGSRSLAEKRRASRGVSVAKNSSFCITYATRGRSIQGSMLRPFTLRSPSIRKTRLFSCRPASTFSKVLLPAPEGPRMQHTSPGFARPVLRERIVFDPAATLMSHSSVAGCADSSDMKLFGCPSLPLEDGWLLDESSGLFALIWRRKC
mmetsp:Transcript_111576/g.315579  ORF Transcript_111576/g.315579 Transcript_111576/m.315579 type:complete len:260 (+) Transcript_111576:1180-1959(+)